MEVIESVCPSLAFISSIVALSVWKQLRTKPVSIAELWIYPIKSCKGIKVDQAKVTSRGFELDRMFMVVDSNGKFVSQRTFPSMALITVQIDNKSGATFV